MAVGAIGRGGCPRGTGGQVAVTAAVRRAASGPRAPSPALPPGKPCCTWEGRVRCGSARTAGSAGGTAQRRARMTTPISTVRGPGPRPRRASSEPRRTRPVSCTVGRARARGLWQGGLQEPGEAAGSTGSARSGPSCHRHFGIACVVAPPDPRFCFPRFRVPTFNCGLRIPHGKCQKQAIRNFRGHAAVSRVRAPHPVSSLCATCPSRPALPLGT